MQIKKCYLDLNNVNNTVYVCMYLFNSCMFMVISEKISLCIWTLKLH